MSEIQEDTKVTRRKVVKGTFLAGAGLLLGRGAAANAIEGTGRRNKGVAGVDSIWARKEQEPRPKIDPRIGVAFIGSRYPLIETGFASWGVELASWLGIQTVEVAMSPRERHYQEGVPPGMPLPELVNTRMYEGVFESYDREELKRLIITPEVFSDKAVTAWEVSSPEAWRFDEAHLSETYKEMYGFARNLLEGHRVGLEDEREMVIQLGNEWDLHLLGEGAAWNNYLAGQNPSEQTLQQAKAYLDTCMRAIGDANQEFPEAKPLKTCVEVNWVVDAMEDERLKRAVNSLLPILEVQPDYVGYSAYDSLKNREGKWLPYLDLYREALEYVKGRAPKSELVVSEFGIPENQSGLTEQQIAQRAEQGFQIAMREGAKWFVWWQLLDNECSIYGPVWDQCQGYGWVRPDGSLTASYYQMASHQAS